MSYRAAIYAIAIAGVVVFTGLVIFRAVSGLPAGHEAAAAVVVAVGARIAERLLGQD